MTYPPGQRAPESRLTRYCDSCRGVDDHPRHIFAGPDGGITYRHMDCCFNAGCPDATCDEILRSSRNARGASLVAFLNARMTGGR